MLRQYSYGSIDSQMEPLLILHGMFGSGENWASYGRQFGENRFVLCLDLPNHGSEGDHNDLEYHRLAGIIDRELNQFVKIKKWIVLGHSMGGKAAMALSLLFPDRVSQCIVVDMCPRVFEPHHELEFEALDSFDPASIQTRGDADRAMASYLSEPMVRAFFAKSLVPKAQGGFEWRFNKDEIIKAYPHILNWPIEVAKKSPIRLRVIAGELSHYIRPGDWDLFSIYFENIEKFVVKNAGHWVQAENRLGFLAALSGIL